MTKAKWRGIETTQKRINERKAVTIINRFGMKSISLPRIDDKKRWAGFPGLTGWARKIAKITPKADFYVEPFAGAAKVYQALDKKKYKGFVLNDKSKFVVDWLRKEFPDARVTRQDFRTCVAQMDSKKTVFLFDFPWYKSYYEQRFSHFDRYTVKAYSEEVLEVCRNIKGKFIITTRKENQIMLNSEFKNKKIKSEYPVSGKLPILLLTTNIKF